MDDKLARDILAQLKALVKVQGRIADALEAANAFAESTDPMRMIQESLGGGVDATGAQIAPDEWVGDPPPLPPDQMWRMR